MGGTIAGWDTRRRKKRLAANAALRHCAVEAFVEGYLEALNGTAKDVESAWVASDTKRALDEDQIDRWMKGS